MPSRIDGIWAKIERAKEHVRDLEARLVLFRNSDPYEVISQVDPNGTERVFNFKRNQVIPPEISIRTGEVFQNLRTALDYVACALIVKNGGTETKVSGYPIFEDAAKYKDGSPPKIKGMSQAAMDAIDLTKPYGGGGTEALWILRQLNDREKHRLLLTTGMAFWVIQPMRLGGTRRSGGGGRRGGGFMMSSPIVNVDVTPANPIFPIEDGTEFFRAPLDVNVDTQFTFDVAFNESQIIERKPLLPTVHQLTDLVEGIVSSFSALL